MNKTKNFRLRDIISISLILTSTYLYFILSNIPRGIETINLYFFEIGSFGFPDIALLAHYCKMKILILSFSLLWYFTCKHWWKSAILVIIAIELAKLITALLNTTNAIDEIDYMTSLPITIPIVAGLVLISNKLNKYNSALKLRSEIDVEIDLVFFELYDDKKNSLVSLKKQYNEEKKYKLDINSLVYLKKLISLRNQFYKL